MFLENSDVNEKIEITLMMNEEEKQAKKLSIEYKKYFSSKPICIS